MTFEQLMCLIRYKITRDMYKILKKDLLDKAVEEYINEHKEEIRGYIV